MFGNIEKYSNKSKKWNDQRLQKMQPEWFADKRVLDIGCHNGIADLIICARYNPKLVIGIDMDHRLIKHAINNLQKAIND